MTLLSNNFEKQIHRVRELIEKKGADVVWNDRLPDPDNPTQLRQIDITINCDGILTIVECRIHKEPQDVKWIEELMGRRASLRADAVIAVSASGFTQGAIKKASSFGIILRDIVSLTEEEINQWGKRSNVWLTFHEYSDVKLNFTFPLEAVSKLKIDHVVDYVNTSRESLYGLFQTAANRTDEENPKGRSCRITSDFETDDVEIIGFKPIKIALEANIRFFKRELNIPSVVAYDEPPASSLARNVYVQAVELGNFEITQSLNDVAVAVDLSPVEVPQNCMFRTVLIDWGRVVTLHNVYPIGIPKFEMSLESVVIGLEFQ